MAIATLVNYRTHVEWEGEKRIETGQEDEEGSDEVINSWRAGIGSHCECNNVDDSRKCSTDILFQIIKKEGKERGRYV